MPHLRTTRLRALVADLETHTATHDAALVSAFRASCKRVFEVTRNAGIDAFPTERAKVLRGFPDFREEIHVMKLPHAMAVFDAKGGAGLAAWRDQFRLWLESLPPATRKRLLNVIVTE